MSSSSSSSDSEAIDQEIPSDRSPISSPAPIPTEERSGYHRKERNSDIPLFLVAQTFARFLIENGNERSLVTIAQDNAGRRRRKPSGIECEACAGGHNSPCFMPTICDCLCKP